jgi:hypothetical protein
MQLTITQNGALYALQHGAPKKYRRVRPKRAGADPIRAFPTLITPLDWFRMRLIPADKAQFAPQDNGAQVADAFPEYRVAA